MHRIERAIRGCKALIACISPRYIVSTICHREIVLADLLKKPIIPVLVLPVPWPPPGGTGLMLAPYVYIDIFGVGGHGGTGLKSDLKSRFTEIESQVGIMIPWELINHRLGLQILHSHLSCCRQQSSEFCQSCFFLPTCCTDRSIV